ncbi:MAG: HlyC/CorC family transporter [Truepera sp.]|nr:HlyC/CorC family transporter [Truepera sp.]
MSDNGDRPRRKLVIIPTILAAFLLAFAYAQAGGRDGVSGTEVALLAGLLILSAIMSGSETALTAVGAWKIRQLREEGQDPSGAFALLERDRVRFITTLLIGNNLVNIAAAALVTQIALDLAQAAAFSEAAAVAYATGFTTLLVLIFGEITPKSFAVHNAVTVARLIIKPVYLLSIVFYPLGRLFTYLAAGLLRLFRLEPASSPLITENELRLMLRSAEESGVLEAQEQEMIKGVIDLEETVVREVMTPRVEVVAIPETATLAELWALAKEHGYSRLPVYRETIDNVRGIVYARDLLDYLAKPELLTTTQVAELMTAPQYVPETLSILNLLKDMRIRKNHLAVVVDEFGGMAGIVTLEDILEEITGEIYDETDEEEVADISKLEDGGYRIQGSAHLEEVGEHLGLTFDLEADYDTLAGFLISRLGYIPTPGEHLDYQGYRFTVQEADERRVSAVLASPLKSDSDATALPADAERTDRG